MPQMNTTIPVSANGVSDGQTVNFVGEIASSVVINNNSGFAIQYSTGGAFNTVANGAVASVGSVAPTSFRIRKAALDASPGYPLQVGMSWVYGDDEVRVSRDGGAMTLQAGGEAVEVAGVSIFFASGAGWSRVFDGSSDTTKLVHLAVKVPAEKLSPNCTIRITHYWTEVGASTKNIVLGHTDTAGGKAFFVATSNSGTALLQTNEIHFGNSLTYPKAPNQGFGSGGSNNGPVILALDGEEGVEILFYTFANANLTSAESVTLENVKIEVLK